MFGDYPIEVVENMGRFSGNASGFRAAPEDATQAYRVPLTVVLVH